MVRRFFVSLAALLLAALAFFVENHLVTLRAAKLTERRFDALEENFALIDREVKERNDRGEYFRYLGQQASKDSNLADLNPAPQTVTTAVLLDRDFRLLARSGRDLTDEEILFLRAGRRSAVTNDGILRIYVLTDFSGHSIAYLALAINPRSPDSSTALYAASLDFKTVTGLDRETFGREDNLLLGALLSRQSAAREVLRLRGTSYLSVRRYRLHENLVLFQLTALPPVYTFFSPYLFAAITLLAAAWLLRGYQKGHFSRREHSEKILHNYSRAIAAQASALSELSRLVERGEGIEEKLVVGDTRQADFEARIRAEREAQQKERKPTPIVIEIMPEERQFRFMNPARTVTPSDATVQLGVREQKLRERAFSDELRSLMAAMGEQPAQAPALAGTEEQLLESIRRFEERYHFPEIDQYLYYLNELYFDEVTGEELAQAMRVAGDAVQSHEFAILLYDASVAAFRCGFVHSVPAELMRTLYLLPKDSIMPNDFADYGYIEATAKLRKNPFFVKRFPTGFADNLRGIHIFPLSESFLRARILFFDSARGGALSDLETISLVRSYLRQVAPAISMFFSEAADSASDNAQDLVEWAVRELRECLVLASPEHPLLISHYVFENSLEVEALQKLVRDIARALSDGEKLVVLSPSHLLVAHGAASSKAIEALVGAQGKKFIIKEREFGKASRNLYTFIEF